MVQDRTVTPERPFSDDDDSTFVEPSATADVTDADRTVTDADVFGRDAREIQDEADDDDAEAPATVEDRLTAVEDVLRSRGFMR